MLEIVAFKPEEIDEAIEGLDSLQQIIIPVLVNNTTPPMATIAAEQFVRHITLAKHALVAMGDYLEQEFKRDG